MIKLKYLSPLLSVALLTGCFTEEFDMQGVVVPEGSNGFVTIDGNGNGNGFEATTDTTEISFALDAQVLCDVDSPAYSQFFFGFSNQNQNEFDRAVAYGVGNAAAVGTVKVENQDYNIESAFCADPADIEASDLVDSDQLNVNGNILFASDDNGNLAVSVALLSVNNDSTNAAEQRTVVQISVLPHPRQSAYTPSEFLDILESPDALLELHEAQNILDGGGESITYSGDFVGSFDSSNVGNIDTSTPITLNSWGSGYNASFEYEIKESDTAGGSLNEWRVEIDANDGAQITNAWMNSGYNASIQTGQDSGLYVITNEGQGYIPELVAGDVISFTIQGNGAGYDGDSLDINFIGLTQTLPATGMCDNPTPITLPFSHDGKGEFCWVVSGNIDFVNSWNAESVEINGESFTNQWSNSLPSADVDEYVIRYNSDVDWGHFEIAGSN